MTRSYPEPFRVTGSLLSIVLRVEDVWQRYNQFIEVCGALNQGFPFSPQRLRWQRLSIPDYTRATSALHCCRPLAAEATPLLASASVAERSLLHFSAASCTSLVLG
jgi:hypothetical protein